MLTPTREHSEHVETTSQLCWPIFILCLSAKIAYPLLIKVKINKVIYLLFLSQYFVDLVVTFINLSQII